MSEGGHGGELALARLVDGWQALASVETVDDAARLVRGASVVRVAVGQARLGLRAQNEAAQLKVEAQVRAGEMLAATSLHQGGRPANQGDRPPGLPRLAELGVSNFESKYWQRVAKVPAERRQAYYRLIRQNVERAELEPNDGERLELEVTTAGLLRYHAWAALRSSAEDEWLTPPDIIAPTLAVLGAIDLDPCSNTNGAPNVPAAERFTETDGGLGRSWRGRVYLNPPYGVTIGAWVTKLRAELDAGRVTDAVVLVPARTDTDWWRALGASIVCFVHGRLQFVGAANSAPFPSAVAYFGERGGDFTEAFAQLGDIWVRPATLPASVEIRP